MESTCFNEFWLFHFWWNIVIYEGDYIWSRRMLQSLRLQWDRSIISAWLPIQSFAIITFGFASNEAVCMFSKFITKYFSAAIGIVSTVILHLRQPAMIYQLNLWMIWSSTKVLTFLRPFWKALAWPWFLLIYLHPWGYKILHIHCNSHLFPHVQPPIKMMKTIIRTLQRITVANAW